MRSFAEYVGLLGQGYDGALSGDDAERLAGALLDGGVPDVELGAVLASMRFNAESQTLLDGFLAALALRVNRWRPSSARGTPMAIGCYAGHPRFPNLAPLLALLLARFGIPVVVHGPLHVQVGMSSTLVLRELGVVPCTQHQQVARELDEHQLAFVPTQLVAPGLAALLAMQPRIGPVPLLCTAARLIRPFETDGVIVTGGRDPREARLLRHIVSARGMHALLLRGADGAVLANPLRRPQVEYWCGGDSELLFDEEPMPARGTIGLPPPHDVGATAAWIQQVLDGARAMPTPIVHQLAACLYAARYRNDFNQAKAVAAITATGRTVA